MIYPARMEARRVPIASQIKGTNSVNNCAFSSPHARRGLSLAACSLAFFAFCFMLPAFAEHNPFDYVLSRQIKFVDRSQDPISHDVINLIAPVGIERVRVDLSLDGGATWPINVAYGITPAQGTNTIPWHLRITPDRWTEKAVIGVRTLWTESVNAIHPHTGGNSPYFTIPGLQILSPANGQSVAVPTYLPIQFRESGSEFVRFGTSTNGVDFTEVVTLATPGHGIVNYELPILSHPVGPLWLAIGCTDYTNVTDIVQINITEW